MCHINLRTLASFAAGIAATAAGTVGLAQENDLYSTVETGRVFEASANNDAADASGTPRIARRITSLEQLAQLLRDASFESKAAESRTVTTTKALEPWLFPVAVTLSDDEQTLQVCVGLGALADQKNLDASKLLLLLEANKQRANAKFGFNSTRNRTELLGQLRNDGVTAEALRDEINRLVTVAKDSESLWQIELSRTQSTTDTATFAPEAAVRLSPATTSTTSPAPTAANSATTTTPQTTTTAATAPAPVTTAPPATSTLAPTTQAVPSTSAENTSVSPSALTGRWSASRASNEAFAILFDATGSFVLVSIKDGQQAKSSGKFTLNNAQLTLEGTDGTRLIGSFAMKSATEFSFQPASTNGAVAAFNFRKSP